MKKFNSFIFYFLLGGSFLFSAKPPQGKPDKDFSTDEKPRPKFPRHWGKPPAAKPKTLWIFQVNLEKAVQLWQDGLRKISIMISMQRTDLDQEKADPRKIERDILDAVKKEKSQKKKP